MYNAKFDTFLTQNVMTQKVIFLTHNVQMQIVVIQNLKTFLTHTSRTQNVVTF